MDKGTSLRAGLRRSMGVNRGERGTEKGRSPASTDGIAVASAIDLFVLEVVPYISMPHPRRCRRLGTV